MPTIYCSLTDLCKLTRRSLSIKAVEELLEYAKAEIESYDGKDSMRVKFEDTNQPHLWSTEGIARLFRGALGVEKGLAIYKSETTNDTIIVDKTVAGIRPHIAAFSAKGPAINDIFITQLIQFQEKLCEGYGMRRKKVSIGIYQYPQIQWPITYKAVAPTSTRFVPLGMDKEYHLGEILTLHPKGIEYSWILEGCAQYPILADASGAILSFPPIINSSDLGKIKSGNTELLIELTGTDQEAVNLTCTILAAAFCDRGWNVRSVRIAGQKTIKTPSFATENMIISPKQAKAILGLDLKPEEISKLLERMRYGVKGKNVTIPSYRADIMHAVDVIEDIAISYGYNTLPDAPLTTYTVGDVKPSTKIIDAAREILMGCGMQELMSAILSHKDLLYSKMNHPDVGTVELLEYKSITYSVLRSWILPHLLDVISANKHNDYPQAIFEQGEVSVRKGKEIIDYEHIAFAVVCASSDYAACRSRVDSLMRGLNLTYSVKPGTCPSYIPGRCADLLVGNEIVGHFGEMHPLVLDKFEIRTPTIGAEINLTKIHQLRKK
ncbi:phenylalanine--tRNA ligase subunit beta [Candidatus Woesearchaeota archaeon]|nr:phenylalanine--tRNA ligase subunit beta [Candidatus Woesearchaeota archaeon]